MKSLQNDVEDFHTDVVEDQIGDFANPKIVDRKLRLALIEEELAELAIACHKEDIPGAADALIDIIYVTIGAAVKWGIDLAPLWEAVHGANMRKAGGPVRADGKKLKPPGWKAADLAALIGKQRARYR